MKRFLIVFAMVAFVASFVVAEEKAEEKAEAKEKTLTGKIVKMEKKDGEKVIVKFSLKTADGSIGLPEKNEGVKLDEMVDKDVELVVMAVEKEKGIKVKEIKSAKVVEAKADAPKADAPKADEPKADAPKADAPKADVK